jgi:hypothetical protein
MWMSVVVGISFHALKQFDLGVHRAARRQLRAVGRQPPASVMGMVMGNARANQQQAGTVMGNARHCATREPDSRCIR